MKSVWSKVKSALETHIPGHSFRMWIEPINFSRGNNNEITLSCPNYFSKKRIQENYSHLIESEFLKLTGNDCKLLFEISTSQKKPVVQGKSRRGKTNPNQMVLPGVGNPVMRSGRMLSKSYTFDEFVVGNNNDFAYSAALSLASADTVHNNALFLLSDTGMGKSHLSQAIGHQVMNQKPKERVYYITAEDFTNEMISSLSTKTSDVFKRKYRNQCDVLLLEDIHFLSGKEHTQVELAMTLDYLFESGKKIMFSSCALPGDIPKLNDQLKSRFSSSLVSKIETPDFNTRVRILRKKAKKSRAHIPNDIIDYLAGELTDDIRQLESGLVGVTAKSSLLGMPIDYALAESVIKNIAVQKKTITVEVIKKLVSKRFGVTIPDMISKSRKQSIVKPRQVAMYLSRKYTDQPLQSIGKSFNRYHATAMHAINTVESGMRQEVAIKNNIEYFSKKLESGKF